MPDDLKIRHSGRSEAERAGIHKPLKWRDSRLRENDGSGVMAPEWL